ncbi:MAG: chloride channel protein, partial [Chloroflexota bacterium]
MRRRYRSVWLGLVIGIAAGLGSIAFHELIRFATEHLLGSIAAYHPPEPVGEGGSPASGPERAWALPIV